MLVGFVDVVYTICVVDQSLLRVLSLNCVNYVFKVSNPVDMGTYGSQDHMWWPWLMRPTCGGRPSYGPYEPMAGTYGEVPDVPREVCTGYILASYGTCGTGVFSDAISSHRVDDPRAPQRAYVLIGQLIEILMLFECSTALRPKKRSCLTLPIEALELDNKRKGSLEEPKLNPVAISRNRC
jgi:hypothetical protein